MCGITGIINSVDLVDKKTMHKFNQSLRHRGPDSQNVVFLDGGRIALGHCRLSIVDLTPTSDQPFHCVNKRFWITFNGEIYNYLELKNQLLKKGYVFKSNSDTEVLLYSYIEWGVNCLNKFNGMWAFAIWDNLEKELFASRDRFGVKPFYYYNSRNTFVFASEQKAFKEVGLYKVSSKNSFNFISNSASSEIFRETLFENIFKLFPGEYLIFRNGEVRSIQWWNTYNEILNLDNRITSDEELNFLFKDACSVRTTGDVNICTTLSGGIDSSTVTSCLASSQKIKASKSLHSFIGSFSDKEYDEFKWASIVCKEYSIPYTKVDINDKISPQLLLESSKCLDDLCDTPTVGQYLVYDKIKENNYKVSVEGHGGDELFGGYSKHVISLIGDLIIQRKDPERLCDAILLLSELTSSFTSNNFNTHSNLLNTPLNNTAFRNNKTHNKLYLLNLFDNSEKYINPRVPNIDHKLYSKESLFFKCLYEDFHYYTLPNILMNYDRLSMKNSVEIRSPFLDYRFVLKAFCAPTQKKIYEKQNKYFLRNNTPFLPNEIRNRKSKSGFTPPLGKYFSTVYVPIINEIIHQKKFKESRLFDGKLSSKIVSNLISKRNSTELSRFWPIINLALIDGVL